MTTPPLLLERLLQLEPRLFAGIDLGFPRFRGQVDRGRAMTTRLSIDDQPHQITAPVHGAAEG